MLFDDIDFGPDGADTVELPIFVLDGEPTTFRFWDGEPYAEGSTMTVSYTHLRHGCVQPHEWRALLRQQDPAKGYPA